MLMNKMDDSIKHHSNENIDLRIKILGDLQVSVNGTELNAFPTRKAELLFSFLVLNRDRLFYRDILTDRFFRDAPCAAARKKLRTLIWQVRSVLEPEGTPHGAFLIVTNREIGFNTNSSYWLDSLELEKAISKISSTTELGSNIQAYRDLEEALSLYSGELLEGVYNDWCICEKERMRLIYLKGLEMMMTHHATNSEWLDAIILGEKLICSDPLREHIYRHLMRYHYQAGNRPSAIVLYRKYENLLRDELNIEPMIETKKLFDAIQKESDICNEKMAMCADTQTILEEESGLKKLESIQSFSNRLDELSVKVSQVINLMEKSSN